MGGRQHSIVLLEYFAGEKLLRMNQISRKIDLLLCNYRIAGNFRGVKYSLFSWASWPPRNFNVGVAYRNVGMQAGNENVYSRKPLVLELEFLPHENYPLYSIATLQGSCVFTSINLLQIDKPLQSSHYFV